LRKRDQLRNPGVDGRIIIRCFIRKYDVGVRTGTSWLRVGTVVSIKCGEFLD